MTKVINPGYLDTPISGVTQLEFARGLLNFAKDYRIKTNNNGKEVVFTNITSPIDRPENIRIAISDIANIYSGTGIEPSVLAPTKRGLSILAQVTQVISVTDDSDPDYRIDLPVSYHVVIKVPVSEHINASVITTGLGRLLSSVFDTGAIDSARLEAILRGSLVPSDM